METITHLLSEIKNGLHFPDLADDLNVLSCLLYKQNNSHRKYKFYQSLKQVQTYIKKFVELNLKHSVSEEDSVVLFKDPKFFVNFSTRLFKGYLLLTYVQNYCKNVVRLCIQQLALCHFLNLHFSIISLVSSICFKVKELQKNVYSWYTKVYQIAMIRKFKIPHLSQAPVEGLTDIPKVRKLSKREMDLLKQLNQDNCVDLHVESNRERISESADKNDCAIDNSESFLSKMKRLLELSNSTKRKRNRESDEATFRKKQKRDTVK